MPTDERDTFLAFSTDPRPFRSPTTTGSSDTAMAGSDALISSDGTATEMEDLTTVSRAATAANSNSRRGSTGGGYVAADDDRRPRIRMVDFLSFDEDDDDGV